MERRSKPSKPSTGLDTSIEKELKIETDLDIYAPYFPDFPYLQGRLLSKGGEANVYEV